MIEDGRSSMFWHDKIQLAISLKCVKHVNDDPLRTSSRLQYCNTLLRSFHFRLRQRSDCRSVLRHLAGVHDKTRHMLLSAHRSISDFSCMFHTSSMWHMPSHLQVPSVKDKVVRRTASQIRKNEHKRGENPETATSRKSLERPEIPNLTILVETDQALMISPNFMHQPPSGENLNKSLSKSPGGGG
jgi:hypothetical protein